MGKESARTKRKAMNNDGWGFMGAGTSDNRLAGRDLQHNRQTRTADEYHEPVRQVTQERESGGPMKHHMEDGHHEGHMHHHMHDHLKEEAHRHEAAMDHHHHHLANHHSRHFDSQHGHDHHKHAY